MFNLAIINIVITLILVYFLLSIITSRLLELFQDWSQSRAKHLETGIKNFLDDPEFATAVLNHPVIKGLSPGKGKKPNYIPRKYFSMAVLDILVSSIDELIDPVTKTIQSKKLSEISIPRSLLVVLNKPGIKINEARIQIEDRYDQLLDGLYSSYKGNARKHLLWIGFGVTFFLGVDTLAIVNYFTTSPNIGAIPLVWQRLPSMPIEWFQKFLGLSITGIAASLSAPYWFDIIKRFLDSFKLPKPKFDKSIDDLKSTNTGDVQKLAGAQISLLTTYHDVVLDQARQSFASALVAAIIGLVFFLGAVIFVLFTQASVAAAIISAMAGALVEVISGINFYLYSKASDQLNEFQSRLDMTQRFLLANSICEGLDDKHRQKTRSSLVLAIAEYESPNDIPTKGDDQETNKETNS